MFTLLGRSPLQSPKGRSSHTLTSALKSGKLTPMGCRHSALCHRRGGARLPIAVGVPALERHSCARSEGLQAASSMATFAKASLTASFTLSSTWPSALSGAPPSPPRAPFSPPPAAPASEALRSQAHWSLAASASASTAAISAPASSTCLFGGILLFFVSARTNKRHHHH